MLSACQLFSSSEPSNSTPTENENTETNTTPIPDEQPAKTPVPTPTPTPDSNPNINENSTHDPVQFYGIHQFVEEFNNLVGNPNKIQLQNPQFYNEDNTYATFSISVSDGSGLGISLVKSTLKVKSISIISSATNNLEYETFYTITGAFLQYIDANLTADQLTNILYELGYGAPMEQINFVYQSPDLEISTQYDPATSELYLDIYYINN